MLVPRLQELLDERHVNYFRIEHEPAFTAQQIAHSTHTPGRQIAKTVIVNVDGHLAMVVTTATSRVDLEVLRNVIGCSDARLATESEFQSSFPGCELGAMPPFGNLWGMEVFVSGLLTEDETITFDGGTHTEAIRLSYADYARLVNPRVLN